MLAEYMNYPKGWEFIKPILAITTDDETIKLDPVIYTPSDIFQKGDNGNEQHD